ncbi:hypothetical protein [Leuconostoc mesenteroides]|uniref:hypothetical protein n=1 Tax=Leuconostoc mesenteroides TaxID=1245 RepID=UPI002361C8F2|nr:hypothetical protein [Leuconostoc mesenteroides]
MSETVVHVTTLEQWKSVLDVWFKQGYEWRSENKEYHEEYFNLGVRDLLLNKDNDIITKNHERHEFIEYSEFMAQQKEDNKMETYYVTQEQLDLIQELKSLPAPLVAIMNKKYGIETLYNELPLNDIEWFNYLSGVIQIEFKVKEQLYRLWRADGDDRIYMTRNDFGTPIWTSHKDNAFTAPLEEIKKWNNPAWDIEKAD